MNAAKEKHAILEQLKVHGRQTEGSDAIYCEDGITAIAEVATTDTDKSCAQEALRILANALFLNAAMRQFVIKAGYMTKFCEMYEGSTMDDQFLLARILLFTTYAGTKQQVEDLVDSYQLAESISKALSTAASEIPTLKGNMPMMFEMALSETTKLMFSVKSKLFDREDLFTTDAKILFKIVVQQPSTKGPLDSPLKDVVNAISGLNLEHILQPCLNGTEGLLPRLVELLQHWSQRVTAQNAESDNMEESGAPLVKIMLDVARFGGADARSTLQEKLLPSEADRDKPLGQGDSLAARLIQITASPSAPHTRSLISALLFELSDNDPATFVKNVGYGNAAGYLMSQGIAAPEDSMKASSSADSDPVNPITGQRMSKEAFEDLPEMTEEEKEREAERLFVLFDRLKKTGVIDVENPVRKAMEEGRFEELD